MKAPVVDSIRKTREHMEASIATLKSGRDTLLQRIATLERELVRTIDLPLASAEEEARVRAAVASEGERWLERYWNVLVLGERGLSRADAEGAPELRGYNGEDPLGMFGALCATDPEAAVRRVRTAIACRPLERGLAAAERAGTVARLEQELSSAKREDEDLVDAAMAAGVEMKHRPDVIERRQEEQRRRDGLERRDRVRAEQLAALPADERAAQQAQWAEADRNLADRNHRW